MSSDNSKSLEAFLAAHPHHHESIEWWPIQGNLRVRLSLGASLPPAHVSSSILAIVFNDHQHVLYLWPSTPTGSIAHFLIGGRPEAGETPEQTAAREVAEETGWRIQSLRIIGFRHFFHLEPRAEKTDRPYPDFVQPIFAARAVEFDPTSVLPADHLPARFIDFASAEQATEAAQRPLLLAAASACFNLSA